METLRGKKIRDIFLYNQNWSNFYSSFSELIRASIIINVCKLLACGTQTLGFHLFTCTTCNQTKKVFHTCKSRFCSSCGKKATEQWIQKNLNALPNVPYQHITFTLPQEIRQFFWVNRHLTNHIAKIPAGIITKLAFHKKLIPGIFTVIHTFGRDLKTNVHFHLSTTSGGLSLDHKKWIPDFFIKHDSVKKMWKTSVLATMRRLYKQGKLEMPPSLYHLNTYEAFNSWLNLLYQKSWVVHLKKKTANQQHNVKYVGRYLKRPPLAETRITNYDEKGVTFFYLSHYTKQRTLVTLTTTEFISRLIRHIPDQNFRLIRYYNWLSNRNRSKLLPIVYSLVKHASSSFQAISWRSMFQKSFGYDPLLCSICHTIMELTSISQPVISDLINQHQALATRTA